MCHVYCMFVAHGVHETLCILVAVEHEICHFTLISDAAVQSSLSFFTFSEHLWLITNTDSTHTIWLVLTLHPHRRIHKGTFENELNKLRFRLFSRPTVVWCLYTTEVFDFVNVLEEVIMSLVESFHSSLYFLLHVQEVHQLCLLYVHRLSMGFFGGKAIKSLEHI